MGKNNQQLIEDVEKRLAWYTLEASEEEFNEAEVEALVQLLTVIEGNAEETCRNSKEALERFWKYRDKRMAEGGGHTVGSMTLPELYVKDKTGRGKKAIHRRYMKTAAVLAAAFFAIGGTSIGAAAVKYEGYFHWLKRDKNSVDFVTVPENLNIAAEVEKSERYEPDEVPGEYRVDVVDTAVIEKIEGLKGFELQSVEILRSDAGDSVHSFLSRPETKEEIAIDITVFPDMVLNSRDIYKGDMEGYEFEYYEEQDGLEYELLSKINPEEEKDYAVIFYHGHRRYALSKRDDSAQQLLELARRFYQYINK